MPALRLLIGLYGASEEIVHVELLCELRCCEHTEGVGLLFQGMERERGQGGEQDQSSHRGLL